MITAQGRRNGYAWLLGTALATAQAEIQWQRQLRAERSRAVVRVAENARLAAARDALIEVERRWEHSLANAKPFTTFAAQLKEMRTEVEMAQIVHHR
jgi:hypothetical protein